MAASKKLFLVYSAKPVVLHGGEKIVHESYLVTKVVNSVAYNPGQTLSRRDVKDICSAAGWDVTIQRQEA